ncbi:MAG: HAD-IC family P-type ATPase, partial [Endomicrobium sp.]|nr:HAD-IC family P-type ATPase [Endomicrobium sp.]
GLLFKDAETLEILSKTDTVILDKTGTLTVGKPLVADILPVENFSQNDFLALAASIENLSGHPFAKAIVEKAKNEKAEFSEAKNFKQIQGGGIKAEINGHTVIAGNKKFMVGENIAIREYGGSEIPVYFASDGKFIGVIVLSDIIKENALKAVEVMRKMGLNIVLLTGDNAKTANKIAAQAGIETVISEVLPDGKEQIVREFQRKGKKVTMIGDGINDAPALERADVGIALGAGADIAMESADIVLMKDDLQDAVKAFKLSALTIRNIKQNLFWAFFYNVCAIPLAAGAFYYSFGLKLSPAFAAAAMSLSSLFVVTNALRLRKIKI